MIAHMIFNSPNRKHKNKIVGYNAMQMRWSNVCLQSLEYYHCCSTTTLTAGKANRSILADMIGMILIMESNIFPCPKDEKKVRDKQLVVAE